MLTSTVALVFSALAVAAVIRDSSSHGSPDHCAEGVTSRLYLGQATPTGTVTDDAWRSFVSESVTPRFPAGFTELRADGRWRNEGGVLTEEHTRILEIANDGSAAVRESIRAIAADYRRRFAQDSVLVAQSRTVYCFENDDTASVEQRLGERNPRLF